MIVQSAKTAPPNSIVIILDSSGGEIPHAMLGSIIASTDTCIAVGCRLEDEGNTHFTLGMAPDVDPGRKPIFQGKLKTPNRKILLQTVIGQTILEASVSHQETMVRVWVNDASEPDEVVVGIG